MVNLSIEEQVQMLNDPKNNIPWDELNRWGLNKQILLAADAAQNAHGAVINKFVHYGYSPVFNIKPDYKTNNVTIIGEMKGAVRFYPSGDKVKIDFQLARKAYGIDDDIYINDRTVLHANSSDPVEREAHDNLVKYGFAGVPVEVYDPRWSKEEAGARQKCLIAIDLSDDKHVGTNQASYVKVDWVSRNLDKKNGAILGAVLTEDERKAYLAGEEVFLRGMKSKKGLFDNYVRYDPISGMTSFSDTPVIRKGESQKAAAAISHEEEQEVAEAKKRSRGVTR